MKRVKFDGVKSGMFVREKSGKHIYHVTEVREEEVEMDVRVDCGTVAKFTMSGKTFDKIGFDLLVGGDA